MKTFATAGNKGKGVRSDCFISLELTSQGGMEINITSKVKALFGKQIEKEIKGILDYFHINHAKVDVEDSGAIPLVIAARMEACIKQLIQTDKKFITFFCSKSYTTKKKNIVSTRLYCRAIPLHWLSMRVFINRRHYS